MCGSNDRIVLFRDRGAAVKLVAEVSNKARASRKKQRRRRRKINLTHENSRFNVFFPEAKNMANVVIIG